MADHSSVTGYPHDGQDGSDESFGRLQGQAARCSPAAAYPNREHEVADSAARRRALHCIEQIRGDLDVLERRLKQGGSTVSADGADGHRVAGLVYDLGLNLQALETLRDVREWHAADLADDRRSRRRSTTALDDRCR
jgi:hypothetical protein